jgi:hypothetical protein
MKEAILRDDPTDLYFIWAAARLNRYGNPHKPLHINVVFLTYLKFLNR